MNDSNFPCTNVKHHPDMAKKEPTAPIKKRYVPRPRVPANGIARIDPEPPPVDEDSINAIIRAAYERFSRDRQSRKALDLGLATVPGAAEKPKRHERS